MKLHHVGFVVGDKERYRANLPAGRIVASLYDPVQKAELELLDIGGETYLELIQPLEPESFTWNFLQKGGGFHHMCYEVESLKEARRIVGELKMIQTLGPVFAPLLEGEVLFARSRNREMVEFVWHA